LLMVFKVEKNIEEIFLLKKSTIFELHRIGFFERAIEAVTACTFYIGVSLYLATSHCGSSF